MAVFLAIVLCPVLAAAENRGGESPFEFLYINASEGTASGGHAALRMGDEVFHFQHVEPDMIRATRDDFDRFRTVYGYTENRTIHALRVNADPITRESLRQGFTHRLLTQDEQFKAWENQQADLRLLKALHDPFLPQEERRIAVKGLGWFLRDPPTLRAELRHAPEGHENPAIARLRALIAAKHGADYLRRVHGVLYENLTRPEIAVSTGATLLPVEGRFHLAPYSFSERYLDLVAALGALQVLIAAPDPLHAAIRHPGEREFALSEKEMNGLARLQSRLEQNLAEVVRADNPSWGYSLLLGMARLTALEWSRRSRTLVFVDPASVSDLPAPRASDQDLRRLKFWSDRKRFVKTKQQLAQEQTIDDNAYGFLEKAAAEFLRTRNLLARGESHVDRDIEPLSSLVMDPIPLDLPKAQLQGEITRREQTEKHYEAALRDLYHYDLLSRNCVTELFRTVDQVMAADFPSLRKVTGADPPSRPHRPRGGPDLPMTPASHPFQFIPFVAYNAVATSWRISDSVTYPSWRHEQIRRAYAMDGKTWVDFRESNVLTSRLQNWNPRDAFFLFYSEDIRWLRPLAGGANLLAGAGQSLAGLFTLPWDRGETLFQGARGVAVSLPELFFFNIRKGSFPETRSNPFD